MYSISLWDAHAHNSVSNRTVKIHTIRFIVDLDEAIEFCLEIEDSLVNLPMTVWLFDVRTDSYVAFETMNKRRIKKLLGIVPGVDD